MLCKWFVYKSKKPKIIYQYFHIFTRLSLRLPCCTVNFCLFFSFTFYILLVSICIFFVVIRIKLIKNREQTKTGKVSTYLLFSKIQKSLDGIVYIFGANIYLYKGYSHTIADV